VDDRQRQQVADELRSHFTAGRIDVDEYDHRLDETWQSATIGDLESALRQLPPIPGMSRPWDPPGMSPSWTASAPPPLAQSPAQSPAQSDPAWSRTGDSRRRYQVWKWVTVVIIVGVVLGTIPGWVIVMGVVTLLIVRHAHRDDYRRRGRRGSRDHRLAINGR